MAKSFCSGCKWWEWCPPDEWMQGFHYCEKLMSESLLERKEFCGGKYKEVKQRMAAVIFIFGFLLGVILTMVSLSIVGMNKSVEDEV